jgi:hypothetical protein
MGYRRWKGLRSSSWRRRPGAATREAAERTRSGGAGRVEAPPVGLAGASSGQTSGGGQTADGGAGMTLPAGQGGTRAAWPDRSGAIRCGRRPCARVLACSLRRRACVRASTCRPTSSALAPPPAMTSSACPLKTSDSMTSPPPGHRRARLGSAGGTHHVRSVANSTTTCAASRHWPVCRPLWGPRSST